ncbi:MAG: flagellar basal-body rod protein FlgG [Planctomycetales bacterium]|nr:flagellar basal-body rod protein FlgG [Planctomycetales bacterium]
MSVQTLYTAATGMESLETKLDVIANNLANVNTIGFKRDRANFEDLFYRHEQLPGKTDSAGQLTPTGIAIGLGSRVSSTQTDFDQGAFQASQNELDIAIEGDGFFQVDDPSGETMYTRAGNFSINANGALVMGSAQTGRLIQPNITFPPDTTGVSISAEGIVEIQQAGSSTLTQLGQIQLAHFVNPQGLEKVGENLYRETAASGSAVIGNPGTVGIGVLRQGAIESSNVEPVQELIDLITTQRAFELNSQAVQAGDQILQLISNLRRF